MKPSKNPSESLSSSSERGSMQPLIVIGRQTGSGGRSIGRKLASMLGVKYFDKELLKECGERLGYAPEIFALADEKRPPLFRSFLHARFGLGISSPVSREELYAAQASVIRALAEEGDAVFVGRTADYILRDHPRLFSVFLHAPLEHRVNRLISSGEMASREEALAHIRRSDSARQGYYDYFTPRRWGEATGYDMTIDSSRMSEETLAELILEIAREKLSNGPRELFDHSDD